MARWTKLLDLSRRLWADHRKWLMAVAPLGVLYLLNFHFAPLWVFPYLEKAGPRQLVVLQGQEALIVEGFSLTRESPMFCCESEGALDLDLTFRSGRLTPGSVATFNAFVPNGKLPEGFVFIRYLSQASDLASGEPCRTSLSLYTDEATPRTLRIFQPEPPPSDAFRSMTIQLAESQLTAFLQTANGPGEGMPPGVSCRKHLQIGDIDWPFYSPLSHEIVMAPGGEIGFRLQRLPQGTSQRAERGELWPVDLLSGFKARSLRIVDSANRDKDVFESREGEAALLFNSLELGADRMEVNVQIPSLVEGFKKQPALVGFVVVFLLAVNGGVVSFVWASSPIHRKRALALWRKKLEFLQEQEATAVDATHKFAIKEQIEEAEEKIRKLTR